ncbi:hypothetical protein B7463_g937, partial [Scytalidium lignicola]
MTSAITSDLISFIALCPLPLVMKLGIGAGVSNALPAVTSLPLGPKCSDVVFSLNVTAINLVLPDAVVATASAVIENGTLAQAQALIAAVGETALLDIAISGTYNISGRFCEPEVRIPGRENHIQLLVHGATYNKNYWSGGDFPIGFKGNQYSWIAYASQRGYPTLSIDRLGSGNSSHPDPIATVQAATEVECHYQIIEALRNTRVVGGRKFSKIAYVGHSVGSVLGNYLAATHPDAVDVMVLTGYSKYLPLSLAGILVTSVLAPAQLVASRFDALPLGYFSMLSEAGRSGLFYSNNPHDFDTSVLEFDFAREGTLTLGEAVSILGTPVASHFRGPILVITGHLDQAFCGLGLPFLGELTCATGKASQMEQTRSLFPKANYSWVDVPHTGHGLNFHYSAQTTFKTVHDYLQETLF